MILYFNCNQRKNMHLAPKFWFVISLIVSMYPAQGDRVSLLVMVCGQLNDSGGHCLARSRPIVHNASHNFLEVGEYHEIRHLGVACCVGAHGYAHLRVFRVKSLLPMTQKGPCSTQSGRESLSR